MHSFSVGSSAHINQICLEARCFYLWVIWCNEINKGLIIWLYVDPFCKYDDSAFIEFLTIHEQHSELLPLTWASHEPLANLYVPSYLAFNIVGQLYGLHHCGCSANVYVHTHLADQIAMFKIVKVACSEATWNLCSELSHKFLNVEIMVVFGMVHP
jgi:hypothetical protein